MSKISIVPFKGTLMFLQHNFLSLHKGFYNRCSGITFPQYIEAMRHCSMCPVRQEAQQVVLPEYSNHSDILFVARNPGKQENKVGRPLYPKAPGGKWFQGYLGVMGLRRSEVNVTNCLLCHTWKDRPPKHYEIVLCAQWKFLEYCFLPWVKYFVLMGNDAIRQYLGLGHPSIVNRVGIFYQLKIENRRIMVFPIYHPAYLLRNPHLVNDQKQALRAISGIIELDRKNSLQWYL